MENCVAPGLDDFDVLLEVVLSLVRVTASMKLIDRSKMLVQLHFNDFSLIWHALN